MEVGLCSAPPDAYGMKYQLPILTTKALHPCALPSAQTTFLPFLGHPECLMSAFPDRELPEGRPMSVVFTAVSLTYALCPALAICEQMNE